MDPRFSGLHDSANAFNFEEEILIPNFEESSNLLSLKFKDQPLDLSFTDAPLFSPGMDSGNLPSSSALSTEVDSPDDSDSDPVLKYLNQILLEENMEERPSMFHDPLALQAAEKSFYDALGEKYPPSPYRVDQSADSPDSLFGSSIEYSTTSSSTTGNTTNSGFVDSQRVVDPGEYKPSGQQNFAFADSFQSLSQISSQLSFNSVNSFGPTVQADTFSHTNLIPNIFSDTESILQFKKGMEEASRFLPSSNQLIIDLDKYKLPPKSDEVSPQSKIKVEKDESSNSSRGRKHFLRQESDLVEQRSSKQSAVYAEDVELSEMFDRVLLCTDASGNSNWCTSEVQVPDGAENTLANGSSGGKTQGRNQGRRSEAVDLRTLLISCAQSVAADDRRTAAEQLKQVRQHSSTSGDANQRLASVFADGLEARLAGTGTELYAALASKKFSAAEKLKAYQVYLSACPFKKISIFFANKMIYQAATKSTTLHIVDFGIAYGFQWPILIQHLSNRPGGPPRLRITGIECPQPGLRPADRIEETGRRLAKYCERFHVPFEFQAIAMQNWETIKIEDLKLAEGEVLAVNCLFRFNHFLDETVIVDNPRDAVLKLVRKMNPDIFVNAVINGSYNAPFFMTRFREALFHYSSLFDMFDATISREDPHRLTFEQGFYRREAINVIACESLERVERPETYKQWHARHTRVGFKPLPLNPDLLNKLRGKVKAGYHKDFVFDEDGSWMLQGWKGRIICAISCWVPA